MMKRSIVDGALVVLITVCTATALMAQTPNFYNARDGRHDAWVAVGLDPAVMTSLGITRWTRIGERVAGFSLDATILPSEEFDMHDYKTSASVSGSLVRFGSLHVATRFGVSVRGTQNTNFTAHGVGTDLTAFVGHYGRRTMAALEIGYDKAWLEHIEHRPFYLANYPDAVDGWYRTPAGTIKVGVTTGVSLGRLALGLRAYVVRSEGWEDLMPPMGTSFSVAWGW
jgi:hypothetical protein